MNRVLSFFFVLCLMLGFGMASAQTTYTKVTSADQLVIGGKYIIVAEDATNGAFAMGGQKSNNRAANSITISENTVSVTEATQNSTDNVPNQAVALVLGAATGNAEYYTFYDAINSGYLYAASNSSNNLKTQATNNENGEWNITFNGNVCSIVASASSNRNVIQYNYNNGTPLFSCYASANQTAVSLYVDATSLSDDPAMTVTAPANNAFFFANSVSVNLNVRNFALGTDGKIKYTLDEGEAQYSTEATFTISEIEDGAHTLALELVDMENASLETPVTASLAFTTDADFSTLLTIPAIQGTEDENAQNGNVVATQGIVIAKVQRGFYIQSSTEAYSGLYVYSADNVADVEIGDMVVVRGTMAEYNGLTEMGEVTNVIVRSSENEIFEPIELGLDAVSEQYESMLIKVTGTYSGTTLGNAWQIANGGNTLYVGKDCYTYTPTEDTEYAITGVLSYSNNTSYNVGWVVLPRSAADVNEQVDGIVLRVLSPAEGSTVMADNVEVQFRVYNFVLGTDGKLKYTLNNGEAQYVTSDEAFTVENLVNGSNTLAFELVDMENVSLETPVTVTVTFEARPNGQLSIRDIQYTTAEDGASPYNDQTVTISGTVTGFNNDKFYIQDAEAAWSGLYIYNTNSDRTPARNDNVTVTGTIKEYNGLTEVDPVSAVVNNGATTPINGLQLASISEIAEPYESVLVTVTGTCTNIGGAKKWTISDGTSIVVFGIAYTPTVGTSYTVTGIVDWFGQDGIWELKPRDENDIVAGSAVPAISITAPVNGSTIYTSSLNATVEVFNFEVGTDGNISFSIDEEAAISGTATSHTFADLTDGQHTIHASLIGTDESVVASATSTFTVNLEGPSTTPIHDIQYTEAEDGASPYNGQTVTVSGIVTGFNSDKFYIQDDEAAWSGLYIYNTDPNRTPSLSDNVIVTGTITEYNGLTEMSPVTEVINNGAADPVSGLVLENISEISEPYESVLVTVTGTCTNIGGAKKWTISDGNSIVVFGLAYTPTVGTTYTVTGIVDWFGTDGIWELKPRDENDIVAGASVPAISITNPANGSTVYSSAVNATVEVFNFTVGTDGNISFSIDDEEAISGTATSHAFTGLTEGAHTIHASLVANDQSVIATATSTFTVNFEGPAFTAIRDIQYTTDESGDSPLKNQTVWVKGVVTSNFINTPYRPVKGYSIQDANEAWSGVWVFDSINNPNIGDSVKFQALVTEYYGLTELKNVANYEVFDIGVATPINVTVNEANSEAFEGCYVRVECVRSVGHTMPYGNWKCVNAANDTVAFSHNFASDTYTIEQDKYYSVAGIVEYSYGAYYVNYPTLNDIIADCDASVDETLANSIEVYPNPTNGQISIVNAEGQNIVVINTLGQIVASIENAAENQTIDMSGLCDGTYFVKVGASVVKVNVIR